MQPNKLQTVESLRGLAALAVTWFHLTNTYAAGAVQKSGSLGWLGVECFFVISGFIIPYALHVSGYRTPQFLRFMARRMVRLEPPYLVSIVLVIAIGFASTLAPGFRGAPVTVDTANLAQHLLYLVPLFGGDWINIVYWTLAYEFAFYILTGLLFSLLWPRSILWTMLLVAALAVVVPSEWRINNFVLLFMLGIATARHFTGRDSLRVYLACLAVTLAAILFTGAWMVALVGGASALLLAFVKIPTVGPLSLLAALSYSLYLTHVPIGSRVINLGKRFGEGQLYELGLSLAALAICLFSAWVFYKLIEAPATALSRRVKLKKDITPTAFSDPIPEPKA